jgi:glucans biosynthesis protein C
MAACGWCWSAFMLFIGMRYMDRDSRARRYGQEILLPFFVLHQTVIITIAYFAVQWNTGMLPKMLAVYLGSFVVTIGLCELVIKRVGILRVMFGMKGERPAEAQATTGSTPHETPANTAWVPHDPA